jgi:hypothetical protein
MSRSFRCNTVVTGGVVLLCMVMGPGLGTARAQVPAGVALHDDRAQVRQQVESDKAAYAAAIVERWEGDARASGRWNDTASADLHGALMRLTAEDLVAAGEAGSYKAVMAIIATGRREKTPDTLVAPEGGTAELLGDTTADLVYTPITPCRLVDTRVGGGILGASSARTFDVDGSSFTAQGGSSTGCGIPFGVARAVAITISVTAPGAAGYFTAWGLGVQPLAAALTYFAGQTTSNTTVVPAIPGGGNDFSLFTSATAHAVIDVLGYYAAPVATPLDCIPAASAFVAVPVNAWTAVDAVCAAGRTATGGGYLTNEGTLGYPNVWTLTLPGAAYGFNGWRTWVDNQTGGPRNVQTWATCCRVPGR